MDLYCFLPTVGDIQFLTISFGCLQLIIIVLVIFQFWNIHWGSNDTIRVNFLRKAIDDPLAYCRLWDPLYPWSDHMNRACIPDAEIPVQSVDPT